MKRVLGRKKKSWLTTEGTEDTQKDYVIPSVPSEPPVVKFFFGFFASFCSWRIAI